MYSRNSLALVLCVALAPPVVCAEIVKVAFIDTLSGAFAPIGINQLRAYQTFAEMANQKKWAGDYTFEFTGFDNKGSSQESLTQLKAAIDQGYHYIVQGNSSGVALALIDAINKNNERNPGKEVVFFNQNALDPILTNSRCSFWHFRFDADSDMKMEALTSFMAKDANIKKVYVIGQNYAHGQQVSLAAKEYLKRKRPDIQIVGDDLHPIGQVKDFSPYVSKIKASGADSVVTGSWGADLALLVKAAKEADLKVNFFTYYGGSIGVPTAMGSAGVGRVKQVGNWHPNTERFSGKEIQEAYKKKFNDDFYLMATYTIVNMLSKAIKETKSSDPVKVAYALEDMKSQSLSGEVEMRKADHQLQQPLYISTWTKVNDKDVKYDQENTGYGWKTDQKIDAYVATQPTSCEMKRPAR